MANELNKLLTTEPCPKCGAYIHKTGGCSHMKCYKCQHEFCWICNGNHYRHRHDPGMEKYCAMSGFKWMLFGFMFIIVALKLLSFYWVAWQWPLYPRHLTVRNVFGVIFVNLAFGFAYCASTDTRYRRDPRYSITRDALWIAAIFFSDYGNYAI